MQTANERLALLLAERRKRVVATETPFPEQESFVLDQGQFIAALCTRRAGKTNGLALRFKHTMDKYPGSLSRYIALTRDSAKDIMWGVLQEMDQTHNWKAQFLESTLTMVLPNGAKLRLMGADMKNFIRRLRGAKSPAVAIDEAQEFEPLHLENLVDNILTPTLADYEHSWLALTGTPGPVPRGLYYDVTEKGIGGYSVHRWSIHNNPYIKDASGFVARLKEKKKWEDTNPTYVREYLGQWVLDLDSLLIKYQANRDHFETLPPFDDYIMGIDIGFNDADAIAIVGWSETSKTSYLVEELIVAGQEITPLVESILALERKYRPSKMVMDEGGLGKKIAEEIRRRHSIPVQPADKLRKMENVALLNDALRTGMFKASKESQFAKDSYHVQIDHDKSTPERLVVKKGFHSDIIDAVLYAFKESPAFAYQAPAKKPKPGTKAWFESEVSEMEEAAIDHFTAIEQAERGYGDEFL